MPILPINCRWTYFLTTGLIQPAMASYVVVFYLVGSTIVSRKNSVQNRGGGTYPSTQPVCPARGCTNRDNSIKKIKHR